MVGATSRAMAMRVPTLRFRLAVRVLRGRRRAF
jgi:hypothetical protein